MWVLSDGLKSVIKNHYTLYFENNIHRVLYERSNITASFGDYLKYLESMTFTYTVWARHSKSKLKP